MAIELQYVAPVANPSKGRKEQMWLIFFSSPLRKKCFHWFPERVTFQHFQSELFLQPCIVRTFRSAVVMSWGGARHWAISPMGDQRALSLALFVHDRDDLWPFVYVYVIKEENAFISLQWWHTLHNYIYWENVKLLPMNLDNLVFFSRVEHKLYRVWKEEKQDVNSVECRHHASVGKDVLGCWLCVPVQIWIWESDWGRAGVWQKRSMCSFPFGHDSSVNELTLCSI